MIGAEARTQTIRQLCLLASDDEARAHCVIGAVTTILRDSSGDDARARRLCAALGQETLAITVMNDRRVLGVFTDASGSAAQFASYPAIDGAGIYQVTLDESLHYAGTSTDGAVLDAQAESDGTTIGTIKPLGGKTINFAVHSLALASPADLAAHALSEDYLKYAAFNQVPGSYVAVIAPGGVTGSAAAARSRSGHRG